MSNGGTNSALYAIEHGLPAHLFMPADAQSFDYQAYVALPAMGSTSTVLTFTVPEGFHGVINTFGNVFVGAGFTEGTGDLVWQLLANSGVVPNYENILASLGSVSQPSKLAGILIKEQQVIALTVKNVGLAVGGAFIGGRLGGWHYPKYHEPDDVWL
jgi:hypothetical protein